MLDSFKNRHSSPPRYSRSIRRHDSPTQMLNSVTQLLITKSPLVSSVSFSLLQSIESQSIESDSRIEDNGLIRNRGINSSLLCCASLSQSSEGKDVIQQQHKGPSVSRNAEELVLISEVLVRTKDGEELERKDLEMEDYRQL